ncbi:pyridoxamine 5'-phosphate oxidase family protein [Cellulomonas sp. JH27-2]|uniref:pyridoxamine 5'-phosphate oxidase family protein n=1 Tax=Cellulomonas sp. JH27-2 TaxID=2774139 RepID=UPI00177F700F|nr:pyridoxamine 5'-phosphate oxidase family protein [Cellulomonas sp. JH27-2]MBD8057648.1 pyridoxamine 5'-phosphate oxidase family protein [Cellulomonas sp. JH27-2]
MPTEQIAKVAELIKDARTAMLTTVAADGSLVSRPMGVQDVDFDGDLWFFADADSHKVSEIEHGSPANAAFADSSSWVSVSGSAEVVRDVAKQRELWGPVAEAWYPDGPETPGLVLVVVHGETAEYWDSPGGRIATVLSLVKAKVKGERYDGGENETVSL